MTTIIKQGIEKIMRIFYKDKGNSIHLRELSRRTSLHGQSIMRHLNFLEQQKLLWSKKEGNLRKYAIRHNKSVYAIFTLFDIEKFEKILELRKQAIKTYLQNLPRQPVYVVLFGSTAKEIYTERSDIDLVLVTNEKIDTKEAEKESDMLHGLKLSTFQITYKEFTREIKLKEDKVIQSAINTGYPLLNHICYYEEFHHERV